MSRPIVVLRPEPGNRVTAAAIEARGRTAIRLPLFATRPIAWEAPDPARYDALIVTSANAIRHGGEGLAALRDLPLYAVGQASAEAARRAGFDVAAIGDSGAARLIEIARDAGVTRALHLGARERTVTTGGIVAEALTVYTSEALDLSGDGLAHLAGAVVLVQSGRAGARFAELVEAARIDRAGIAIAAISQLAARAAGPGWERVIVARAVSNEAMVETGIGLAD